MPLPATTATRFLQQHSPCRSVAPRMPPRCLSLRPPLPRFPLQTYLDAGNEHPQGPFCVRLRLPSPASCESPCGSALSHRSFCLVSKVRRSSARPYKSFPSPEVPGSRKPNPPKPGQSGWRCLRASPKRVAPVSVRAADAAVCATANLARRDIGPAHPLRLLLPIRRFDKETRLEHRPAEGQSTCKRPEDEYPLSFLFS